MMNKLDSITGFIRSRSKSKVSIVPSTEHEHVYNVMEGVTKVGFVHFDEKYIKLVK